MSVEAYCLKNSCDDASNSLIEMNKGRSQGSPLCYYVHIKNPLLILLFQKTFDVMKRAISKYSNGLYKLEHLSRVSKDPADGGQFVLIHNGYKRQRDCMNALPLLFDLADTEASDSMEIHSPFLNRCFSRDFLTYSKLVLDLSAKKYGIIPKDAVTKRHSDIGKFLLLRAPSSSN